MAGRLAGRVALVTGGGGEIRMDTALAGADAKDWGRIFGVNVLASAYCCTAALPHLRPARGGTIGQRVVGRQGDGTRRFAEPREIAYPILFLSCAASSFVAGATSMVDAGRSIL